MTESLRARSRSGGNTREAAEAQEVLSPCTEPEALSPVTEDEAGAKVVSPMALQPQWLAGLFVQCWKPLVVRVIGDCACFLPLNSV